MDTINFVVDLYFVSTICHMLNFFVVFIWVQGIITYVLVGFLFKKHSKESTCVAWILD
jgi:hypothetical protein